MTLSSDIESTGRADRRPWIRGAIQTVLLLAAATAFAGIVISYAGPRQFRWRGFDVEVGVRPGLQGRTRIVLNPLGDVSAETHSAPVELRVELRGISFEETKKLILNPPPRDELEAEFEAAARKSLQSFALFQLGAGVVGALAIPLIARSRRASHWIGSGAAGAGIVALCFTMVTSSYDPKAFENPTYTGSLREAGWVIGLARDGFARAEALSERLKRVATNISALYGRLDSAPPLLDDEGILRILHVSDIHNNIAAIDFIKELAARTEVSMVIDTGDLTDLGLPVETRLVRGISELGVPYLFIAGNHDSRATVAAVSAFPGAQILNSEIVDVDGFRILGSPDPSSKRPTAGSVDTPDEALRAEGEKLLDRARASPVDIAAVHNPKQAQALIGVVPVILAGHMHKAGVDDRDGTVIINAGTTGGAGIRFFERANGVPFTATILGFSKASPRRLAYIDQVSLDVSIGEYSITRKTILSPAGSVDE